MIATFIRTIVLISLLHISAKSALAADVLPATPTQEELAHLIEVWLDFQKDAENIPAIMGAVIKGQNVLWQGAVGVSNSADGLSATTDSLTSICSITKVFTATATMKLIDEGKLKLDDDVQALLPAYSFQHRFAEQGPVTVRSLLTHSSGLPRDTGHAYWSAPDFAFPTEQQFIDSVSAMSTLHPVGEQSGYSNVGYGLLGAIIETVSGASYKDYMEQQLFKPLGMLDSTVEMQASTHGSRHALGYSARSRHGQRKQVEFYQTKALQPAAGISTSISDFTKFAMWQFEQPDSDSAVRLMRASNRDRMLVNQTQAGSRGFGYQVYTDDQNDQWATHGGMCPGYNSFIKYNKSQQEAFAIFTNANQVKALAYVNGLIELLNSAHSISAQTQTTVDLSQYTGFYDPAPWNSPYYVSTWGSSLILMYLPSDSLRHALYLYQHVKGDVFEHVAQGQLTGQQIEFLRDEKGRVISILDGHNRHPKT